MTKTKRIGNILVGIVLIGFAYLLMAEPDEGLPIVVGLVGLGMTMRGLGTLLYYFQMARFMVGGKLTLYRGIIFLDFGIFTVSLVNHRGLFMIL